MLLEALRHPVVHVVGFLNETPASTVDRDHHHDLDLSCRLYLLAGTLLYLMALLTIIRPLARRHGPDLQWQPRHLHLHQNRRPPTQH